jgi:hypothetical protein
LVNIIIPFCPYPSVTTPDQAPNYQILGLQILGLTFVSALGLLQGKEDDRAMLQIYYLTRRIWGSHVSYYEEYSLMDYNVE